MSDFPNHRFDGKREVSSVTSNATTPREIIASAAHLIGEDRRFNQADAILEALAISGYRILSDSDLAAMHEDHAKRLAALEEWAWGGRKLTPPFILLRLAAEKARAAQREQQEEEGR